MRKVDGQPTSVRCGIFGAKEPREVSRPPAARGAWVGRAPPTSSVDAALGGRTALRSRQLLEHQARKMQWRPEIRHSILSIGIENG